MHDTTVTDEVGRVNLAKDATETSPSIGKSVAADRETPTADRSRRAFIPPRFEEFGKDKRSYCFSSLT